LLDEVVQEVTDNSSERRWLDEVVKVTGLSLQHLKEAARDSV